MPTEEKIRESLSKTLGVLEAGLTLIEVNHKLSNPVGAKGFVDILAKDALGNLVIIELKRSDQAAREALFEILKYMPLFRQQHGVPAHRIRCFIVSTTWHELLVPYSEFRRLCETQTEGFKIAVIESGNVTKSEKVTDHAQDPPPTPFRLHLRYLYPTLEERTKWLALLRDAYTTAGSEGYLLLLLKYAGGDRRVIYPFGAYFVPTQVTAHVMDGLEKIFIAEMEEIGGDLSDTQSVRESVEDAFLATVQESIGDHFRTIDLECTPSGPEAFTAMVEDDWAVESIERVGPFESALVTTDSDVINLVKGVGGASTVRYSRLASPRHKLDWAQVRDEAKNCLRGNPTWERAFAWFLEHVETQFADGNVLIHIYNPLYLPESLYRFAVVGDPRYVPQMTMMVVPADGSRREGVSGTIVWDGQTVPRSIQEAFAGELNGSVADYYLFKSAGAAWEFDEELVRRHGLEYGIWWLSFVPGKIEKTKRLTVSSGKVVEASDQGKPHTLNEYIKSDAAKTYLTELFSELSYCLGR